MKLLLITLLCILLFESCNNRQHEQQHAIVKQDKQTIDFPVIVQLHGSDKKNHVYNLLLQANPQAVKPARLVNPEKDILEFINESGKVFFLDWKLLSKKYDFIVFNTKNDPMPCREKELLQLLQVLNMMDQKGSIHSFSGNTKKNKSSRIFQDTSVAGRIIYGKLSNVVQKKYRWVYIVPDTTRNIIFPKQLDTGSACRQRLDMRKLLAITFENDLITFNNTDHYYTNGISFRLQAPGLLMTSLNKAMIPYFHEADFSYELRLASEIYTPTDTRIAPALKNDRPYASNIYLGFSKNIMDRMRKLRLRSEMQIGYLGPHSPGASIQKLVHETFPTNDEPVGWETQLKTDLILNYSVELQKALNHTPNSVVSYTVKTEAGTYADNVSSGFSWVAGKLANNSYDLNLAKHRNIACSFYANTSVKYVVYNALLQGGMINRDNVFVLKYSEIAHFVCSANAGAKFTYKDTGIELGQHFLSPEYKGGLWHKWGSISLLFKL